MSTVKRVGYTRSASEVLGQSRDWERFLGCICPGDVRCPNLQKKTESERAADLIRCAFSGGAALKCPWCRGGIFRPVHAERPVDAKENQIAALQCGHLYHAQCHEEFVSGHARTFARRLMAAVLAAKDQVSLAQTAGELVDVQLRVDGQVKSFSADGSIGCMVCAGRVCGTHVYFYRLKTLRALLAMHDMTRDVTIADMQAKRPAEEAAEASERRTKAREEGAARETIPWPDEEDRYETYTREIRARDEIPSAEGAGGGEDGDRLETYRRLHDRLRRIVGDGGLGGDAGSRGSEEGDDYVVGTVTQPNSPLASPRGQLGEVEEAP